MKSMPNKSTALLSDGVETRSLRIDANAKAFKELISGIYQDKSYAIARETMANAFDSHVCAGIPERAFQLHLPTEWEPEYWIRDFGVSMDHEMVMGLYSTLFQSTKDDPNSDQSNKFVGKFGLGSKSPFAYTDAFQVTAFLDGEQRIYDVFFDQGLPQIALLMRGETDEENGILISFAVNPKDCRDFERAVVRSVEGLDVLPDFIGKEPSLHTREIKSEGVGWMLLDRTQSGMAEAKQGTVLYPLNFNAVIDCPAELRPLFNCAFRFDFEIGQLDVVTSREALSYDADTSRNIIERLQMVMDEINQRIVDSTKEAKTFWDFSYAYNTIKKSYPEHVYGVPFAAKPTFKGKTPQTSIGVRYANVRREVPAKDDVLAFHTTHERFGDLSFCKFSRYDVDNKVMAFRPNKGNMDYSSKRLSLLVDQELIVVTEDITEKKRYPSARIKKLIENIKWANHSGGQVLWIRHTGDQDYAFKRLFAAFGCPTNIVILNLLDVPYAPPSRAYDRPRRAPYKYIENGNFVTPAEGSEAPDNAWLIPMRNGVVDHTSCKYSIDDMQIIKTYLESNGISEKMDIIGVPASSKKILRENPQWINFSDFLDEHLPEIFDKDAYSRAMLRTRHVHTGQFCDNLVGLAEEVDIKKSIEGTVLETILDMNHRLMSEDCDDDVHYLIFRLLLKAEHRLKKAAEAEHTDEVVAAALLAPDKEFPDFSFDAPFTDIDQADDALFEDFKADLSTTTATAVEQYPLINVISMYSISTTETYRELVNYIEMKTAQLQALSIDKLNVA